MRFRQGLSTLYLPLYDFLVNELDDSWEPYSSFRSFTEQDQLFAKGRSKAGPIVTNAQGGQSPHNYGCASDWCKFVDGIPIWPDKESQEWRPYFDAIEKAGLRTGSDWGDFPHNELWINCSWSHVLVEYTKNGMRGAQEHIENNLRKV